MEEAKNNELEEAKNNELEEPINDPEPVEQGEEIDKTADEPEPELITTKWEALSADETCTSLLKTILTADLIEQYKTLTTKSGFTLLDCILPGFENYDHAIGIYAKESDAYQMFADIFNVVFEKLHGFGKDDLQPECNWGDVALFEPFNEEDAVFIESLSICCRRSLVEYPFVGGMTEEQLVESLIKVCDFYFY